GEAHAVRGGADDEGDLALEGQQLGAGGSLDRAAGDADRAGRLEEVRGGCRPPSALLGAGDVVQVDSDDLAWAVDRRHVRLLACHACQREVVVRCIRNRISSSPPGQAPAADRGATLPAEATTPVAREGTQRRET